MVDQAPPHSYWLRMLRVVTLFWVLASASFAVDPALLIDQVEALGFEHYAHIPGSVRFFRDGPWRSGWLVLAWRDAGYGEFAALLVDVEEHDHAVSSHFVVLPGISAQLKEFLLLRSYTRVEGEGAILTELDLSLVPDSDRTALHRRKYSVENAWGRFEILRPQGRDWIRLDLAKVRNPRRRGVCTNLVLRAYALFEKIWK